MTSRRKHLALLVLSMLGAFAPRSASTQVRSFTLTTSYTLPGGLSEIGFGSFQFNQATNAVAGSMTFNLPPLLSPPPVQLALLICAAICLTPDAELTPVPEENLLDLSGGNIFVTSITRWGAAGTATFTSHGIATGMDIVGDLTGLNFALVPAVLSFKTHVSTLVSPAGPGTAIGNSTGSVVGHDFGWTSALTYDFLGNPSAALRNPRLITADMAWDHVEPSTFSFRGTVRAVVTPEPSTVVLLVAPVALGLARCRRGRLSAGRFTV